MASDKILALDVGSAGIKAVVGGLKKDGKLAVLYLLKMPSRGMRKGVVTDQVEATTAISQALNEIKRSYPEIHKNIFLNVGNAHPKIQTTRGIVAVARADYEIHQDDIDRVVQASQAVNLPPNRMIVHAINQEFLVDGVGEIRDPLGMVGARLEVNSLIIEAFSPAVKNLGKCIETAGGAVNAFVFGPLAAGSSLLSKNQKDLGVVLVDIGSGTTSIGVYEEGRPIHFAVFPVGSSNITNDLAVGLKISVEAAEAVKSSFGYAVARDVPSRNMIDLKKIDPLAKGSASRRFVAEIMEMRLAEIFEFVNNELRSIGKAGQLPAGVVLTGGGAKLSGIVDLAKHELQLPAQVGMPDLSKTELPNGELAIRLEDPEFSCAFGLLKVAVENNFEHPKGSSVTGLAKKLIDYFMP